MDTTDNETMCLVENGAAMGKALERYWIPAIRSERLEAGGKPIGVELLGKKLVAFRSPDGTVGVLQEGCPHRGVSLTLARNEECGLRCIFHGWKIDSNGVVLEAPSEPASRTGFASKVKVDWYPTVERAGIVWTYLGTHDEIPAFPNFEFMDLPPERIQVSVAQMDCNWVQCIEGGLDSSHVSLLHSTHLADLATTENVPSTASLMSTDSAPRYELIDTDYGFRAAATRKLNDEENMVRVTEFVLPWNVFIPSADGDDNLVIMVVPIDDRRSLQWFLYYNAERPFAEDGIAKTFRRIVAQDPDNWRLGVDVSNSWTQDRKAMASGHWSGIPVVYFEDIAVQEGSGPIAPRDNEHLGSSDAAVIKMRRRLVALGRSRGPGRTLTESEYGDIRARQIVFPVDGDWRS